jgi:hypothetical protein
MRAKVRVAIFAVTVNGPVLYTVSTGEEDKNSTTGGLIGLTDANNLKLSITHP